MSSAGEGRRQRQRQQQQQGHRLLEHRVESARHADPTVAEKVKKTFFRAGASEPGTNSGPNASGGGTDSGGTDNTLGGSGGGDTDNTPGGGGGA